MEHQVKVLRALDTKFIRPVGGTHEIPVNARVIAATNRDLPAMMAAGQFRADLYYRLRSFMIPTEPLAKHPEDIPLLARHFWKDIAKVPGAFLSDEFVKALQVMPWHGNVRDLKWTLVSLFRYTGLGNPTPKHLRTVVWYENQQNMPRSPAEGKISIDAHRVECLMHLRRTDDALRACEVALRPMTGGKRLPRTMMARMAEVLRRHAGELELLCLHPLLFADSGTFKAVDQFKWGVVDFLHVLQVHPGKAKETWDNPLSRLLQQASKAVFQQVDRVVKGK
jgi:DNA-binding NtrC family response regulator